MLRRDDGERLELVLRCDVVLGVVVVGRALLLAPPPRAALGLLRRVSSRADAEELQRPAVRERGEDARRPSFATLFRMCWASTRFSEPPSTYLTAYVNPVVRVSLPSRIGSFVIRSSLIDLMVAVPPGKLTPGCVRGATSTKSPTLKRGASALTLGFRSLPLER